MPSQNVEIVRRAHEALNSGDMDTLVVLCDAAFRLDMSDRIFNPAVYEGHGGIRRFYSEVRDVWEVYVWEPQEFIETRSEVVALLRSIGTGERRRSQPPKARDHCGVLFELDRVTASR